MLKKIGKLVPDKPRFIEPALEDVLVDEWFGVYRKKGEGEREEGERLEKSDRG